MYPRILNFTPEDYAHIYQTDIEIVQQYFDKANALLEHTVEAEPKLAPRNQTLDSYVLAYEKTKNHLQNIIHDMYYSAWKEAFYTPPTFKDLPAIEHKALYEETNDNAAQLLFSLHNPSFVQIPSQQGKHSTHHVEGLKHFGIEFLLPSTAPPYPPEEKIITKSHLDQVANITRRVYRRRLFSTAFEKTFLNSKRLVYVRGSHNEDVQKRVKTNTWMVQLDRALQESNVSEDRIVTAALTGRPDVPTYWTYTP